MKNQGLAISQPLAALHARVSGGRHGWFRAGIAVLIDVLERLHVVIPGELQDQRGHRDDAERDRGIPQVPGHDVNR